MPLDGQTRIFGIVGNPVAHSLSPAMHNAAFEALGANCVYVPFAVTDIPGAMTGLRALGIRGVSVTIPHKRAVIDHLDSIDPIAARIGAVNTLVIDQGHIRGYNTDWLGANRALETITPLAGRRVLVLGAGGAARAIGFGLLEKGATVIFSNRTLARGRALARELGCDFVPPDAIGALRLDALINATSVGMHPHVADSPVPAAFLPRITAVMDIVYAPRRTRLLAEAGQAGCRTVGGLDMLLYQGVAQFELWTGLPAPVEAMRTALAAKLKGAPRP